MSVGRRRLQAFRQQYRHAPAFGGRSRASPASSPKPGFGLSKRKLGKLDVKISETKADLIRWMFVFWMGQIGALLGILFTFFRK